MIANELIIRIEAVLLAQANVADCAVLQQSAATGTELVGYVVPTGPFRSERLAAAIRESLPDLAFPIKLVAVSSIPLSDDGGVREEVLRALPVADADTAGQYQQFFRDSPDMKVVIRERRLGARSLHVSDVLPAWKGGSNTEIEEAALPGPQVQRSAEADSAKPAISHGAPIGELPDAPQTLQAALRRAAANAPDKGVIYVPQDGSDKFQTYSELLESAERVLGGLRRAGLKVGDPVLLQLDRAEDFITGFWGCVLGGFVPVPCPNAPTYDQLNGSVAKLHSAWQTLDRPPVLTSDALIAAVSGIANFLPADGLRVLSIDEFLIGPRDSQHYKSNPDDLALLLLTSGSTGAPKAVMQSHRALLLRTFASIQFHHYTPEDVSLNWLPLDHVGGIVMVHIHDVILMANQVHARIQEVLADPLKWLDWLDRYHAASTWAPNFAYGLINARGEEIARRHWDFSKLRVIVNGGEAVISKTARRFLSLLAPHGLRGNAMQPCFGMSEICSGAIFMRNFTVESTSDDDPHVEVGEPLPGFSMRIADKENRIVSEGTVGQIQVQGPYVTSGYFRNANASREAFTEDRWFTTGDLGFIRNGQMTISGREKDVIIVNGVNIHCHEIEKVVEEISGLEPSFTAAFAMRDPGAETDEIAICFSPASATEPSDADLAALLRQVRTRVGSSVGVHPAYLVPVAREVIPKTSIGKIQRSELGQRMRTGEFDEILKRVDLVLENARTIPDWFYTRKWQQRRAVETAALSSGHSIIFADQAGVARNLADDISRRGGSCILVQRGPSFEHVDAGLYSIDLADPSHYVSLFESVIANGYHPNAILHLWSCDTAAEPESHSMLDLALDIGVLSVLHVAQALQKVKPAQSVSRLLVVTRGVQNVNGKPFSSAHSALCGFIKTVQQELPSVKCRHVDLELMPAAEDSTILQAELAALPTDIEVAYRDNCRYVSRLANAELATARKAGLPFAQGGTFLLTGGFGEVALELARHLCKEYGARLLLIGRTPIEQAKSATQQNALSELAKLGGQARYEIADVCDAAALERAIAAAEADWHAPLSGVFHLAGLHRESLIADETRLNFRSTIAPKVHGTWALRQILRSRPNAFLVGFSSINGFFGGFSSGAYAAANSFLDTSIELEHANGRRAISLAWSLWDEIGMSRGYAMKDLSRAQGYLPVSRRQGWRSFLAALQSDRPTMLIGLDESGPQVRRYLADSAKPLHKLVAVTTNRSRDLKIASDTAKERSGGAFDIEVIVEEGGTSDPAITAPGVTNRAISNLERDVTRIWSDVLGTDVDPDGNFFDLGGSSVLAAQMYQKIRDLVGDRLTMTDLFRFPTVRSLCQFLARGQEEQQPPRTATVVHTEKSITEEVGDSDVAIIGMAGRFPGARNIHEFWRNIRDGVESIRSLSREELEAAGVSRTLLDDPSYVPVSSTLDDVDKFDASFFGYSPREASLLDPQTRLFLECAWEALESSGYNPQNSGRSVGVFASQSLSTYLLQNVHPELNFREFVLGAGNLNAILGNGSDFLPTRVSYKLNLKGPSVNVQTACSSSLVAVHMARQVLLRGECEMVLAGGVSIYLPQDTGYCFQEGMILSPDGHCRPFDSEARGTVFGRGVGIVVLKRLSAALRDRDQIFAVIKGSAINNDGAAKVGYTAPGIEGQADVIAQTLANAGVDADTISYIEAHGTGTPQGDPIEIAALTRAFRENTKKNQFCALGSVKGNIGHLDVAAGITGLIKTALMLKHRQRPPSVNFVHPNPHIDFTSSPFYVNAELDDWPSANAPRRAGVSSFGMGGTNAHVILEEAPELDNRAGSKERPAHLLAFSAKTPAALRELAARHETYISEMTAPLGDACFTAATGRAHWKHRVAVVGDSPEDMSSRLRTLEQEPDGFKSRDAGNGAPPIAFLFTGQGAQYSGMARQLYDTHPGFKATLDRCSTILGSDLPKPLIEIIYPADPDNHEINATNFTQPALFAVEYALAELWRSWGIVPAAVMGHSIGEYVAACVAGVISLEDALHVVAQRARLMQAAPGSGEMVAVLASEEVVEKAIRGVSDRVSFAAINGPAQVVVSGEHDAINGVLQALDSGAIRWQRLAVSHAFHSLCMDPVLDEFERAFDGVRFGKPQLTFISNVTGRADLNGDHAEPSYWRRHLRQPVRFADGIKSLIDLGYRWFVEVGPHPVLSAMGKTSAVGVQTEWLPSLRRGTGDWTSMLQSLAALYVGGANINWNAFDAPYARNRVTLPSYPFERQRHWISVPKKIDSEPVVTSLPGREIKSPAIKGTVFEAVVSAEQTFLKDHRLFGMAVFPATGYLAAAHGAARQVMPGASLAIENFTFAHALVIPDASRRTVQSVLTPLGKDSFEFQFFSQSPAKGNEWVLHASGTVRGAATLAERTVDVAAIRARCTPVAIATHYAGLHARGLEFGPAYQGLSELFIAAGEALGHVVLPVYLTDEAEGDVIHPAFLDAAQQTLLDAVHDLSDETGVLVPVSVERVAVHQKLPTTLWSHARVNPCGSGCYLAEISLYNDSGMLVGLIEGLRVQRVQAEALKMTTQRDPAADWVYEIDWQPSGRLYSGTQPAAMLLETPDELAKQVSPLFGPIGDAEGLPQYHKLLTSLDRLCGIYVERAFSELGWRPTIGARFTVETLGAELGVLPRYMRLFRCLIEILRDEGRVGIDGDEFIALAPLALADYETLRDNLLNEYGDAASRAQIKLVAACGEQLAQVLRGSTDPLQLLFPGGSVANLEQLYGESAFARVYNRLAGGVVSAACARATKRQRLRVLEIGAGTGGTTRYALPKLSEANVEYVFTDVGSLFVHKASEKFGSYRNARFETLDIERDPLSQGFAAHQFDIILASNVLHATADLRLTLGHVRDLLAPRGLLVVVEGTGPARWVDLTFGLTEGWWRFVDNGLRPRHPLLSRGQWMSTLLEAGFTEAAAFPEVEHGEGDGWQIIAIAQGPDLDARALGHTASKRRDRWVIVSDGGGVGSTLRDQFAIRGEAATVIQREDLKHEFAKLIDSGLRIRGVIHLASLDATLPSGASASSLGEANAIAAGTALSLVQTIVSACSADPPRLWLVTRGVHNVAGALDASSLPQSLVWGLGRTIALEHPELRNVRVDIDPRDPDAANKLCEEILAADDEDQIAIRGAERHVARLVRKPLMVEPDAAPHPEQMRSLVIGQRGILDTLHLADTKRRAPGPSEVEIQVQATGLNFRDVLSALGMYPGPTPPFGGECAGIVVRVGQNVRHLRPGDEVVALAYESFSTFVTTKAEFVTLKPPSLSFENAATLPAAFLTAIYGLKTKARLKAGERVLIHAAAGGVGYAAVQIAQQIGAEVFATAGSEEKRKWLRSVGVQHVFDSRTTDFVNAVLQCTGGKGVDVVLNSLAGDFIEASISATAEGGRFIELGKTDIWEPERIAARRPDLDYVVVDFAAESDKNPALISEVLPAIVADAAEGRIPPMPVTVFPVEQIVDAFRFMAQARHTGKIVVTQQHAIQSEFPSNACYLITGGYGALGLAVAGWMTDRGAKHFVLMGRNGLSAAAAEQIHSIEGRGATVEVVTGDVSIPADVESVVVRIRGSGIPLRGVIHAAGTLDDGILVQQSWERFDRLLRPKAIGAWNLHNATAGAPLDFFVLFSTVASMLGSAGQSNHAAANAFLDALAFVRRQSDLPALSINWGAWSEIGAAATAPVILERLRVQGIKGIPPNEGLRLFGGLLRSDRTQSGVLPIEWDRFVAPFGDHVVPYFALVAGKKEAESSRDRTQARNGESFVARATGAPVADRRPMLVGQIREQIRRALGFDARYAFDDRQPLYNIGVDSLMAVELRNILGASLSMKGSLPATLLFDYPTIDALADYLLSALGLAAKQPASPATNDEHDTSSAEIAQLSDEEAELRLIEELESISREQRRR